MKITKQWLKKKGACDEGYEMFVNKKETDLKKICKGLIEINKLDWVNWLVTRKMNQKQCVQYAIFAAEQVLGNYEKEFPNDERPRLAIEAAKKYFKIPSEKNKSAAESAAESAASAAESAARSAASAAWSAAECAAWSAAWSAASAASAAWSAARSAARSAAWSAARSAAWSAAESEMKTKIINYGLKLLGYKI